ncbi:MAG TPA: TolC family protein [Hydrogenophaga sp.]
MKKNRCHSHISQQRLLKPLPISLVMVGALCVATPVQSQTLPELLEAVRSSHPAVRAARQTVDAAEKGVEAAKGRYWPTVSTVLEAGSKNATAVPSKYLRIEQNLWDGGSTEAAVESALSNVSVSELQLLRQEQLLQLEVIDAWQAAHTARGRILVADSVAQRLREHEAMMLRRVQAEASATIELQLIKAQVLQADIERRKAQSNFEVAVQRLEQLTGMSGLLKGIKAQPELPDPTASTERMNALLKMSWQQVVKSQPQVLLADAEVTQGAKQVNLKRAETKPQLYARVDRAFGGGAQTNAFVGVRYSVNTGWSQRSELAALEARMAAIQASRDASLLQVEEQVRRQLNELEESAQRYNSLKLAVSSSRLIHESYIRQFVAGKKSWLDVMSAIRDVAANEYALNEAIHGYAGHIATLTLYESFANRSQP